MKTIFAILFFAQQVLAAEEAEHAEHAVTGVPTVVYWQAANVVVLAIIIYFALRKKLPEFFRTRQAGFLESAEKSKQLQEEAEKSLTSLKHKLDILESTTDESIERARAEAHDLKRTMIREAQEMAARIRHEAEEGMKMELAKAKFHLREEVVQSAVAQAKDVLQKDIGQADHKSLQEKFANSLQGVRV